MPSCFIVTPFCGLRVHSQQGKIIAVDFTSGGPATENVTDSLLKQVIGQIQSYCRCSANQFELPLAPSGTDFQQRVWLELSKIPAGQVKTYGEIALKLATSPRAVGHACRKNPVPLIIPCHRVVSKTGIGGFAGATDGENLLIKRRLLSHEGVEIS